MVKFNGLIANHSCEYFIKLRPTKPGLTCLAVSFSPLLFKEGLGGVQGVQLKTPLHPLFVNKEGKHSKH